MLGHTTTLEVELQAEYVEDLDDEVPHKAFLSKFKEKGRVRNLETSRGNSRVWFERVGRKRGLGSRSSGDRMLVMDLVDLSGVCTLSIHFVHRSRY